MTTNKIDDIDLSIIQSTLPKSKVNSNVELKTVGNKKEEKIT